MATRSPYEKCLSKFVKLDGGVRCCLATLMKAFLIQVVIGKICKSRMRTINFLKVDPPRTCWWPACHGCCKKSVPSCLLVPAWIAQFNSGNYIFISLKLSVKSSLNASMTSGQHSQSLRLGRNYRISFCLLNIFKKRNSSQRPKTDMQNTA